MSKGVMLRLRDLAEGGLFCDGDWVESRDQDPNGTIRLLQLADIGDGEFRNKSSRWLRPDQAERIGVTYVQEGDILIARMPDPLGRACIVPKLETPSITAVDVAILRVKREDVDPRWLMWWLNSPQTRATVASLASGTTRQRITRKKLEALDLLLPPIGEQRRIVETLFNHLSRLDKAFAELSDARTNLILFERAMLHDEFSLAVSDDEKVEFTDFFNVVQPKFEGYKQKDYQIEGTLPIIDQGSALIGGYVNDMTRRIDVQRPLIVFGDHTRCVKFVDFPFAIGADGTKVLEPTEEVDPRFAYWQLRATELRNRGYARHMGELRKVRFWLPETSTQKAIVQEVERAFEFSNKIMANLEEQDTAVATLRQAILHSAFSRDLGSENIGA